MLCCLVCIRMGSSTRLTPPYADWTTSFQVIDYYARKVVPLEANKPADEVARQINAALAK